jgi:hypothetical protein
MAQTAGQLAEVIDIARGDPFEPGLPDELVVLAWFVGIFWTLVAAILTALWFALRKARARRLTSRDIDG